MLILMKLFFMDLWLTLLWPWTVASIWLFMGVLTKNSERIWRVFSAHVFSREEIKLKFRMSQLKTQMKQIWCLWAKIDMLVIIIIIPNLKLNFVQIKSMPFLYSQRYLNVLQGLSRKGFNFHHTQTRTCASHNCALKNPTHKLLARTYPTCTQISALQTRAHRQLHTRTLILCMHKNEATLSFYTVCAPL